MFTMSQPARFCGGRTCLTKFYKNMRRIVWKILTMPFFFGIINDTDSIKTKLDFTSAKGWEIFEILQDIERHEGYEEKYKSMEHEDETGLAGTGGTGVDRRAGECESGDKCVGRYDCKWVCQGRW